jgi:toxin ParE1/3/4
VKSAILHSEADAELIEAMDWYDDKDDGLGLELMVEVQRAIAKIELDAGIGARYGSSRVRFFRTERFPYVIYYREFPDHIWIAAIAHERRRPGYWRGRKPE